MPLLPLVFLLLFLPLAVLLGTPLLLVQRYRIGTARRRGRAWAANLNTAMLALSGALFLWAAAVTNFWVPQAFAYSLAGFAVGLILALLGLSLTRWERTAGALYYTPNRWLVLLITLAVAARLLYSLWRGWHAWQTRGPDHTWLAEASVAGSIAVGAIVLGYYLAYAVGVRRRLKRRT